MDPVVIQRRQKIVKKILNPSIDILRQVTSNNKRNSPHFIYWNKKSEYCDKTFCRRIRNTPRSTNFVRFGAIHFSFFLPFRDRFSDYWKRESAGKSMKSASPAEGTNNQRPLYVPSSQLVRASLWRSTIPFACCISSMKVLWYYSELYAPLWVL